MDMDDGENLEVLLLLFNLQESIYGLNITASLFHKLCNSETDCLVKWWTPHTLLKVSNKSLDDLSEV